MGREATFDVDYELITRSCSFCKRFGHNLNQCTRSQKIWVEKNTTDSSQASQILDAVLFHPFVYQGPIDLAGAALIQSPGAAVNHHSPPFGLLPLYGLAIVVCNPLLQ